MSLHVAVAATPPDRTIPAHDLEEKPMLWAWLRFARATVEAKVNHLDDDAARRRLVPSATTLAGVLSHLTTVERHWFGTVLGGVTRAMPFDPARPDGDWDTARVTGTELLADYRRACDDSDAVINDLAMDSVGAQTDGDYTLRWAITHVFGDTVRHAGQADILRELTDGKRGW